MSSGIGDHLRAAVPSRCTSHLSQLSLASLALRSLTRLRALIGRGKCGDITSAGWQITLCNPTDQRNRTGIDIHWHISNRYETIGKNKVSRSETSAVGYRWQFDGGNIDSATSWRMLRCCFGHFRWPVSSTFSMELLVIYHSPN